MGMTFGARGIARSVTFGVLGVLLFAGFTASPAAARQDNVISDIPYAIHGGIQLSLDVYEPAGHGPFPAVVVIPGGRWVEIDKTKHSDVPIYLADHGIAAFAIGYRSALEAPYPAAIEDVSAAVRWVRAHASDYQVDPDHIGAVGVSSGGHLAALVGARGHGPTDRGARVDVVASFSGPMDLRPLVETSDLVLREAVRDFLGCAAGQACGEIAADASPITYVDPTDPPMILINSDDEIIPVDQAQSMAGALDDAGIDDRLWIVQGGHGAGYGGGNKILDRIIPDLQAWVEGRPAPAVTQGVTQGAGKGQETEPASADAGKGGEPMPTAGSQPEQPAKSSEPAGRVEESAPMDAIAIAAAMIALILVIVLLIVIVRLRRKVASLSIADRQARTTAEGT